MTTSARDLQARTCDVATQAWTPVGASPAASGSAVRYQRGKILTAGGGTGNANPVVRTSAVIDMNQPNPAWRTTAPMAFPRYWHSLVPLPDGKVLAVGGGSEYTFASTTGTLTAGIWDPATETWSIVASMAEKRMYHSTAVLLPDGRVLVAGGQGDMDHFTAEIYSPPYLFNGPRPTIASASSNLGYGGAFSLATPDATSISTVRLSGLAP